MPNLCPIHTLCPLSRSAPARAEPDGRGPTRGGIENSTTNILNIDTSLAPYLPYYLHLLSLQTDPMITHMQGEELRQAMMDALAKIFMQLAARRPTLLILEDWHWHDEPSEQVVKHLAG